MEVNLVKLSSWKSIKEWRLEESQWSHTVSKKSYSFSQKMILAKNLTRCLYREKLSTKSRMNTRLNTQNTKISGLYQPETLSVLQDSEEWAILRCTWEGLHVDTL